MRTRNERRLDLSIVAAVVLADQIAKTLVREWLPVHASVNVIPGFVDVTHVRNTGAAFGILNAADFPLKSVAILVVASVALLLIALFAARQPTSEKPARLGLALILGGAIGNLIDRAVLGHVVDFVDVYWRDYHFWAFNVADASITIGASVLILDILGLWRHVSKTA